jgi:hypothetical protein
VKSIAGIVVQSSSEPVGEFECSNPLFNRIRALVRWAQRSNMMSVMTDCPQREKRGWLEEDHLNGPALRYEFDLAQLFTKMLNDIADSQLPTDSCRRPRRNTRFSGTGARPVTNGAFSAIRRSGAAPSFSCRGSSMNLTAT